MDERDVFAGADEAFVAVVARVEDDQWDLTVPAQPPGGEPRTVRELVAGVAYDDAWMPDTASGRTMAEVGPEKWKGDLLGDDAQSSVAALGEQARSAVLGLDGLEHTVHCSFGDYPAREFLWQVTNYRALVSWDIAQVTGQESPLDAELAAALWAQIAPVADEWREFGVFGPRVEVPDDASDLDKLLGATGRPPSGQ